jgi:hypothetical protein
MSLLGLASVLLGRLIISILASFHYAKILLVTPNGHFSNFGVPQMSLHLDNFTLQKVLMIPSSLNMPSTCLK